MHPSSTANEEVSRTPRSPAITKPQAMILGLIVSIRSRGVSKTFTRSQLMEASRQMTRELEKRKKQLESQENWDGKFLDPKHLRESVEAAIAHACNSNIARTKPDSMQFRIQPDCVLTYSLMKIPLSHFERIELERVTEKALQALLV